jgi:hypothetical protein
MTTRILESTRVKGDGKYTHTSMHNPRGKFNITDKDTFWKTYSIDLKNSEKFGITEVPLCKNEMMPIISDIDIKIPKDEVKVPERNGREIYEEIELYTMEEAKKVIQIYQSELSESFDLEPHHLYCALLKKPCYPVTKDGVDYLKHGFHLHFINLAIPRNQHAKKLISAIKQAVDISKPFQTISAYKKDFVHSSLIDDCVTRNPWLLYGSSKADGMLPYLIDTCYNEELEVIHLEKFLEKKAKLLEITPSAINLPELLSLQNHKWESLQRTYKEEEKEEKEEKPKKNKTIEDKVQKKIDIIISFLKVIDPNRFKTYDLWLKLLTMCRFYEISFELFDKLCKDSGYEAYDADKNKKEWDNFDVSKCKKVCGLTTLRMWAENDGIDIEPIEEEHMIAFTDLGGARLITKKFLKHIYIIESADGHYMEFLKIDHFWVSSLSKENQTFIDSEITKIILNSNIKTLNKDDNITQFCENIPRSSTIFKAVKINYPKINSTTMIDKIIKTTKGKLCFINGIYNFFDKTFTLWEDVKEEIYTQNVIQYDFKPRNETHYKKARAIIESIFGNGVKYNAIMNYQARRLAGHIEDKVWAIIFGERDCGKGVNDLILKETFQSYIGEISADQLLCFRQTMKSDVDKDMGFMINMINKRIITTSEIKIDEEVPANQRPRIDGILVKKIHSGGDVLIARKLHCNSIKFKLEGSMQMNGNDIPKITVKDAEEFLHVFECPNKFVSQEEIDLNPAYTFLKLQNPNIKNEIRDQNMINGFLHCFIEAYDFEKVKFDKKGKQEIELFEVLKDFEACDKSNFLSNEDLELYITGNKLNMTIAKLKSRLEKIGAVQKQKMVNGKRSRGLEGVKHSKLYNDKTFMDESCL